jgi:hypothetical protein
VTELQIQLDQRMVSMNTGSRELEKESNTNEQCQQLDWAVDSAIEIVTGTRVRRKGS